MQVASVSSSVAARVPSKAPEINAGHDGDGDDGASKAAAAAASSSASAPAATVNSSGQKVGQVVNVKA
ncbi:hypothetical protein [Dyella sp. A6]|uniref:hypothetical protein n=1 Tax=Dyella aluminiiresistens TaxID=3069105 RepID=UPI002E7640BA|nr:hypothetical protein [Dyella sp. A6]